MVPLAIFLAARPEKFNAKVLANVLKQGRKTFEVKKKQLSGYSKLIFHSAGKNATFLGPIRFTCKEEIFEVLIK